MDKKSSVDAKRQTTYYLIAVGIVCIFIAIFLGTNILHDIRQDPRPVPRVARVELIAGWMTLRYISRTYQVPEQVLLDQLHVPPSNIHRLTLSKLAKQQKRNVAELIEEVRSIIIQYQQSGGSSSGT